MMWNWQSLLYHKLAQDKMYVAPRIRFLIIIFISPATTVYHYNIINATESWCIVDLYYKL